MSLAEIICHHCGQDYAHEYWTMGLAGDPRVCKSCRRDTNPDAADAPRWVPGAHTVDDESPSSPVTVVTQSRKQCRMCRDEYDGLILGSPPVQGSPLPYGICPRCAVAEDRAMALATAPVVPYAVAPRS